MRILNLFIKGLNWRSLLRIFISLIAGSLLYGVWLAIFLGINPNDELLENLLWISAPLVTSLGFSLGVHFFNKIFQDDQGGFLRIVVWPLTGCSIGALVVYWFGPMLVVFSMLVGGVVSIFIRDVILQKQGDKIVS